MGDRVLERTGTEETNEKAVSVRCQAKEGGIERTCQEPGQRLSQLPQLTVLLDDGANDASRGTDKSW